MANPAAKDATMATPMPISTKRMDLVTAQTPRLRENARTLRRTVNRPMSANPEKCNGPYQAARCAAPDGASPAVVVR
jgi:hypothetical protein